MLEFIRKRDKRSAAPDKERVATDLVSVCCCCDKVLETRTSLQSREMSRYARKGRLLSHGLCPDCYEDQLAEFRRFTRLPSGERIPSVRVL